MTGVGRVVAWPARLVLREIRRWQRGHLYGWRAPRWWPARWAWPGPRDPHAGRSVAIFVGGERFEFAPVTFGRLQGHVYPGAFRATEQDIRERIERLQLPTEAARVLAIVSEFEGGAYDAIQTYDRAKFSWGFIQFAATGGLPRVLNAIRAAAPDVFTTHFRTAGIDVDASGIVLHTGAAQLRGRRMHDRLHDTPALWTPFVRAAADTDVRDAQVRIAYENYYAQPLNARVHLGGAGITLRELVTRDDFGRALVIDRAVNRGVGHTIAVFRQAIGRLGATRVEDAPAILAAVRAIESADARRLSLLEERVRGLPPSRPLASIGHVDAARPAR